MIFKINLIIILLLLVKLLYSQQCGDVSTLNGIFCEESVCFAIPFGEPAVDYFNNSYTNKTCTPCYLNGVSAFDTPLETNFNYVCIFEDEFTGDAIDFSKWHTGKNCFSCPSSGQLYVDNGTSFQFDHPGLEILVQYNPNPIYCICSNLSYYFTCSGISSQYQFPLFDNLTNVNYQYGICQLNATLPAVQTEQNGPLTTPQDPPYGSFYSINNPPSDGMIHPAFFCGV